MSKGAAARHRRFVEEYIVDLNGTQAAIRAGYSPRTAGSQAFDLLKKPEIQKAIAEAKRERAEKTGRTAEDVLKDIQSIAVEAHQNGDLKTALKALELEGRHAGMFVDKVKSEMSGDIEITWQGASK